MQSPFCLQSWGQSDWLTKDVTSLPRTWVPARLLCLDIDYVKDWVILFAYNQKGVYCGYFIFFLLLFCW